MMYDPDPDAPDEFAARLQAQPPVELPARWRAEILAAASSLDLSDDRLAGWRRAAAALAAWLWPHPLVYAGLAAAWAVILALRLLTIPPSPIATPAGPGLVTTGAGTVPEDGWLIFQSGRLASRESSWDPTVAARP